MQHNYLKGDVVNKQFYQIRLLIVITNGYENFGGESNKHQISEK